MNTLLFKLPSSRGLFSPVTVWYGSSWNVIKGTSHCQSWPLDMTVITSNDGFLNRWPWLSWFDGSSNLWFSPALIERHIDAVAVVIDKLISDDALCRGLSGSSFVVDMQENDKLFGTRHHTDRLPSYTIRKKRVMDMIAAQDKVLIVLASRHWGENLDLGNHIQNLNQATALDQANCIETIESSPHVGNGFRLFHLQYLLLHLHLSQWHWESFWNSWNLKAVEKSRSAVETPHQTKSSLCSASQGADLLHREKHSVHWLWSVPMLKELHITAYTLLKPCL